MRRTFAVAAVFLCAAAVHAGDRPESSPLDDLLSTPVSTAAKYDQNLSDAAASVTVITAEEIARFGWHTVADLLASVRGVFTTYDRNYSFLGIRGIGLLSDYNSRFVLLLDGYPLTNAIDGNAPVGTTLAIDLSAFQRVELVRGPGSVLYGTGAMFGVINLIPKDERDPSALMLGAGSPGVQTAAARLALPGDVVSASVAATWQERNGGSVSYTEVDVARDRDFDDYGSVLATVAWRRLRFLALHSTRTKGVPTASWNTVFGGDERTTDGRTMVGVRWDRELTPGRQLAIRAQFDRFTYEGDYPYETMWHDASVSTSVLVDGQFTRDLKPNHRVVVGARLSGTTRASYRWGDENEATAANEPFTMQSLYAQSEWQPRRGIALTTGASYDRRSNGGGSHFTPRAGLVVRPNARTAVKVLYGEGFRMPSVYERFFRIPGAPLDEESLRTAEVAGEYRLTPDVLLTASVFHTRLDDVIHQHLVGGVDDGYHNAGRILTHGVELQADFRRADGTWTYVSYSLQRARHDGGDIVNSPAHLAKAGVSSSTSRRLQGALELLLESSRRTLDGAQTDPALVTNMNVTASLTRSVRLALAVRNAFDVDYAYPGGPEHTADVLPQDGRTYLVRLTLRGR